MAAPDIGLTVSLEGDWADISAATEKRRERLGSHASEGKATYTPPLVSNCVDDSTPLRGGLVNAVLLTHPSQAATAPAAAQQVQLEPSSLLLPPVVPRYLLTSWLLYPLGRHFCSLAATCPTPRQ